MSSTVQSLLLELEQALKNLRLWNASKPSDEALASEQPFCIDTLDLNQWLQWVFIPRMNDIASMGDKLPHSCGVEPLLGEWIKGRKGDFSPLFVILKALDECLNEKARY